MGLLPLLFSFLSFPFFTLLPLFTSLFTSLLTSLTSSSSSSLSSSEERELFFSLSTEGLITYLRSIRFLSGEPKFPIPLEQEEILKRKRVFGETLVFLKEGERRSLVLEELERMGFPLGERVSLYHLIPAQFLSHEKVQLRGDELKKAVAEDIFNDLLKFARSQSKQTEK